MIALWVLPSVAVFLYAISRATAMPAARGVSASDRLAAARALVALPEPVPAPVQQACRHVSFASRHASRHSRLRSRVAFCSGRAALVPRHDRRP